PRQARPPAPRPGASPAQPPPPTIPVLSSTLSSRPGKKHPAFPEKPRPGASFSLVPALQSVEGKRGALSRAPRPRRSNLESAFLFAGARHRLRCLPGRLATKVCERADEHGGESHAAWI